MTGGEILIPMLNAQGEALNILTTATYVDPLIYKRITHAYDVDKKVVLDKFKLLGTEFTNFVPEINKLSNDSNLYFYIREAASSKLYAITLTLANTIYATEVSA